MKTFQFLLFGYGLAAIVALAAGLGGGGALVAIWLGGACATFLISALVCGLTPPTPSANSTSPLLERDGLRWSRR